MSDVTVIGIDLAKNVFQVCGVDKSGKTLFNKQIARDKLLAFMANMPPCLVGMEACSGAHYWAKQFQALGHTPKMMKPQEVKAYVGHHKNDANDAAACAEAVTRPRIQCVTIKTDTQLTIQSMHRARSHYIKERTASMNMVRGLLAECGIAMAKGQSILLKQLAAFTAPEDTRLNAHMKSICRRSYDHIQHVDAEIAHYTQAITRLAKQDPLCTQVQTTPGLGPMSTSALIACIGRGETFKQGRGLSAFLGLVPKQHSSGGKTSLGGISKRGNSYLRQLLIHGGRSCVKAVERKDTQGAYVKQDAHSEWIRGLLRRMPKNKVAVAVANKNARIVIALLKGGTAFDANLAHSVLVNR